MPAPTIHKKQRNPKQHALIGRRVAVPQRFTDVEDDGDGFCFDATVVSADEHRAILKFDYTGEREAWNLKLVRSWLSDEGVEDLLGAFTAVHTF